MNQQIYKLPQSFLDRLVKIYPGEFNKIASTFLHKKNKTFRINYLKTDINQLRADLAKEKIKYKTIHWPPGAFILKSNFAKLQKSFLYKQGHIYVQNLSSMIPPFALEPEPEEDILDLCAAPGAKTTQLVSLTRGKARVVAVEKNRVRFYKLLANLKIQGAQKYVKPLIFDGTRIRGKYPEYFDKILLDVPCSTEGRFRVDNPRSFRYWKYRKIKEMFHKQKKLFKAAFYALKPGGVIVYSTCTFAPEENEKLINWAIDKFSPHLRLLPLKIPLKNTKAGLRKWRKDNFISPLKLTRRILPTQYMEGFFIAKLRKID
jgi:16S rRNA (cytosine1407-C5)-methyltransferase